MRQFRKPIAWHIANGFRSFRSVPSSKWLVGKPFDLETQLANGAATNVNLAMRSVWSTDREVARKFGLALSETATKFEATVAIDAVALRIIPFSDATTALWTKVVNLLKNATAPYLTGTIDGQPYDEQITNGISHFLSQFESDQAAAADEITGILPYRGPIKLRNPIRIDLGKDQLALKTDADIAFGAAVDVRLQFYGTLVPNDQWNSFQAGGGCEVDGEVEDDEILGARSMELSNVPNVTLTPV